MQIQNSTTPRTLRSRLTSHALRVLATAATITAATATIATGAAAAESGSCGPGRLCTYEGASFNSSHGGTTGYAPYGCASTMIPVKSARNFSAKPVTFWENANCTGRSFLLTINDENTLPFVARGYSAPRS